MTTVYFTATSVDGFIADERNSVDWLLRLGEGGGEGYERFVAGVGAVLMGSTTYDWILDHEVRPDHTAPRPWPYALPTWVMTSRSLRVVPGADVRFASGDVRPVHRAMTDAASGGVLWVVGGGDLAGQLADAGLLDELVLSVAPVTLGAGAPLLPRRLTEPGLRLVDVGRDGPFAVLRYVVER